MILGRFTGGADLEALVASDEGLALVPASAASAGTDGCGEQAEGTGGVRLAVGGRFTGVRALATVACSGRGTGCDLIFALNKRDRWSLMEWEGAEPHELASGVFEEPQANQGASAPRPDGDAPLRGTGRGAYTPTCCVSPFRKIVTADGNTITTVVVLVQPRAPHMNRLSEGYIIDAVQLELHHQSGKWRATQSRIAAATLHGTSCSIVQGVRFTGSIDKSPQNASSYGVVVLLETRSGLEGSPPTRHAQLACLHMHTHSLVAHRASWIAEALPTLSFDAIPVASDDGAMITVNRDSITLWSRAAKAYTSRIDMPCHSLQVAYAHNAGKGMMSLVLLGDDCSLYHAAAVTTSNNRTSDSQSQTGHSWQLVSPPSLLSSPSERRNCGIADSFMNQHAIACAFDQHDTLIVATHVGDHHVSVERLAVETGKSLGVGVCSLQILDSRLVDISPLRNRQEVVSAAVIPSRTAAKLARMRRKPEMTATDVSSETRMKMQGALRGSPSSSDYTRGVVLGVCCGKDEGALLNGEYGFGMRVIAEIGGSVNDAEAEDGDGGSCDEEDDDGVDFGSPDLFSTHAGEAGSLLLFSYGAENHTQVLRLSNDGAFDDAGPLGSVVNGESATIAFGFSPSLGLLVQVTAESIRAGFPFNTVATTGKSASTVQQWECLDGARIEHATIEESHCGLLTCYVSTSSSKIFAVKIVQGGGFVDIGFVSTGSSPVSALGTRGHLVAYSTWGSGQVCVCKCEGDGRGASFRLWKTLQAPDGADGTRCIRSLAFSERSSPAVDVPNGSDSANSDFGECLAAGTGDGCMLCWDLKDTQETSSTPTAVARAEIGDSPVRSIRWVGAQKSSRLPGFLATSAGQATIMTCGAEISEFQAFRVCADVLRGHRSLSMLGRAPVTTDGLGEGGDAVPPTLFAVVTQSGGLALAELETGLSLRFQRAYMQARPEKIAYHSSSQTLVVGAVLPSGHTALRFYDAAPDSTMSQLREQILMQRGHRLSVLQSISFGSRQMIAAAVFAAREEEGSSTTEVGCGFVNAPQSTLSLMLPLRKLAADESTTGPGRNEVKKSRLALRPMYHMDFDGRCAAVCAVGDGNLALAVDDRIFVVRPNSMRDDKMTSHSEGKSQRKQRRRVGATPLKVVAGAGTPGGGAVLSLTALSGNRILVSEFMAGLTLYNFCPKEAKLKRSGGEEVGAGYGPLRRLCRVAYTSTSTWHASGASKRRDLGSGGRETRQLREAKHSERKKEDNIQCSDDGVSRDHRATTTFLGDWAGNSLVCVHHMPKRETAAEKSRRLAQHIAAIEDEPLPASTVCRFRSPVICVDEGSFQPASSDSREDARSILVVTRGGTVVEVSQRGADAPVVCRTVL
eukprot:g557.t1